MVFGSNKTHAHTAPVAGTAGAPVAGVGAGPTTHTHGTTHTTPAGGGGLASHIPGTRAHEEKKLMQHGGVAGAGAGAGMGTTGVGAGGVGATGAGGTGTGGGLASKIPGTKAHAVTHSHEATHASALSSSHPTTTSSHAPGHHTHTTGQHGNLRPGEPGTKTVTTTTTTVVPQPSVGDKVSGKVDVALGKVRPLSGTPFEAVLTKERAQLTHNPGKVAVGEIKQTEGKRGLEAAGLAYPTGRAV
ncbi:hypothetical protein NBRC10512_000278 [Rhodotorula toruloides]|uniref:Uncharacterized protein n=1 Tax=Rhodotorula toruloides (strain NP11) TaxID=1130832 RepID=M7XE98_RHOT1|nr:uncharacterized protein RHTO_05979 [Rhodotorula toruloides NP11]EMS18448.1 hypothetical protein RHTO_05979 [Rhodotorula toruloides NP11]